MNIELLREAILSLEYTVCINCGIYYSSRTLHNFQCSGQKVSDAIYDIKKDFIRASGDTICPACGKEYNKHPLDKNIKSYDDEPFLIVLCGGQRVKL